MFAEKLRESYAMRLKWDESPIRIMDAERGSVSQSVMMKILRLYADDGEYECLQDVRSPANGTADGLLGALELARINFDNFAAGPEGRTHPPLKLLLIHGDSAPVNEKVARIITEILDKFENIVVLPLWCASHHLSNSTKSSTRGADVGSMLRSVHVIRMLPVDRERIDEFCRKAWGGAAARFSGIAGAAQPAVGQQAWRWFVKLVAGGSRGPFFCADTPFWSSLAAECAALWPDGPFLPVSRPHVAKSFDRRRAAEVIAPPLRRQAPLPIESRWWTVEAASWWFIMILAFEGLLGRGWLPSEFTPRWWPGVDPAAPLDEADLSARMATVRDYLQSEGFLADVTSTAFSSHPR